MSFFSAIWDGITSVANTVAEAATSVANATLDVVKTGVGYVKDAAAWCGNQFMSGLTKATKFILDNRETIFIALTIGLGVATIAWGGIGALGMFGVLGEAAWVADGALVLARLWAGRAMIIQGIGLAFAAILDAAFRLGQQAREPEVQQANVREVNAENREHQAGAERNQALLDVNAGLAAAAAVNAALDEAHLLNDHQQEQIDGLDQVMREVIRQPIPAPMPANNPDDLHEPDAQPIGFVPGR